jgi:hypothetical protein
MEKAYKNLGYFLILLVPLTLLGFYKTYFNQFPVFNDNTNIFIHLHAIIASIWILMLIAQPLLIRYKKNAWHKKIGRFSYLVFPLLILSFFPQMIRLINSEHQVFVFFPLADSVLLMVCYSLAIYYRKNPALHMRYMIGSALVFLGPTIGRIGPLILGIEQNLTQNIMYGIIYLILIGLIFMDSRKGKKFQPYIIILSAWVIHQIAFNLVF